MKNLIYGLIDPRSQLVRYIGKSTSGMRRPRDHAAPSGHATDTHKDRWIRSLIRIGLGHRICVLEEVADGSVLYDRERWWIAYGRALGWPLTNATDGGPGTTGISLSDETRQKISAKTAQRMKDPAQRALVSAAMKARMALPEERERMRAAATLRMSTDSARRHASEVASAMMTSPEARKRIGDANGKRLRQPHERAKNAERARKQWQQPWRLERGRLQKATVLSWQKVHEIRGRIEHGERQVSVARRLGISQSIVSDVVLGKTWAE